MGGALPRADCGEADALREGWRGHGRVEKGEGVDMKKMK